MTNISPTRVSRSSERPTTPRIAVPRRPTVYRGTVTIAQTITGSDTPDVSDLFQVEIQQGQETEKCSRKYFRSREVSDVHIGLTPDSHLEIWITEIRFARDVVFRGYARRVHVDAELRPDERITVLVAHSEVLP
jgi:hypothetical protein